MIFLSASRNWFGWRFNRSLAGLSGIGPFFARPFRTTLLATSIFVMSSMVAPALAQSQAVTESLIQATPNGFKVVSREVDKTSTTTYMIPDDEMPAFWKQRVSTQIIYNPRSTSYFTFRGQQQRHWQDLCDASSVDYAREGMQNGYVTHLWLQACRFRDTKNKPIFGLSKMIDGDTHAYVVQVVFRYAPDDAELAKWVSYLDAVELCGVRTKGPGCQ